MDPPRGESRRFSKKYYQFNEIHSEKNNLLNKLEYFRAYLNYNKIGLIELLKKRVSCKMFE